MDARCSSAGYVRVHNAPQPVFVRRLSRMVNTSIPEWITAVVAVAALVAAIWAGWTSWSLLKTEVRRDRASDERTRREQATHIAGWTVYCPEAEDAERKDGVSVKNASTAAVYDVVIESGASDGSARPPLTMTILPPGEFVVLVDPKYHWSFPLMPTEVGGVVRPITKHTKWQVISLTFTDAQGTRWQRVGARLTPIEGATPPSD